jgi:hypothetical protein
VGARYHPGVIWGPFLLALALGLVVSAGLYFAYLWPQVEPDEAVTDDAGAGAAGPPLAGASETTEAETEAPAPASESSPA